MIYKLFDLNRPQHCWFPTCSHYRWSNANIAHCKGRHVPSL